MYEIQDANYVSNLIYSTLSTQITSKPYQILQNDELTGVSFAEDTLRAQLSENKEDQKNVSSGISQLQTTNYAVNTISEKLDRMKELATDAAAGGIGQPELAEMQAEFEQLMDELNDIAITTSPGGNDYILNKEGGTVSIAIGDGLTVDVSTTVMTTSALGINDNMDLTKKADAEAALAGLETAISEVDTFSTALEGKSDTLTTAAQSLDAQRNSITSAQSVVDSIEKALDVASSLSGSMEPLADMLLMAQSNLNAEAITNLLNEDDA